MARGRKRRLAMGRRLPAAQRLRPGGRALQQPRFQLGRTVAMPIDLNEMPRQQLVARIKRTSKYYGQTKPGEWFDVRVVRDMGYGLRGNNNNYRFGDVVFGVRLDDGT